MDPLRYATKWARGITTPEQRPGAPGTLLPGAGLVSCPAPQAKRTGRLPTRPAAPPAIRCPGAPRHMLPAGRAARRGAPCRGGSQPIKSPGFLQPYGPRGEQQCLGPFTSKAAIRGKAPPEIFFFPPQPFIPVFFLSFFFLKGISNSRARASLMPFDGD